MFVSTMALALWFLALGPLLAAADDCTCVPESFCTTAPPPTPSDTCPPGELCCASDKVGDGLESRWAGYSGGGWSWGGGQRWGGSWNRPPIVRRPIPTPRPARPAVVTPRPAAPRATLATLRPNLPPSPKMDAVTSHRNARLLPLTDCGTDTIERISDGLDAKVGTYTWLVLLEYIQRDGEKYPLCAGSLISSRYVLTAAHCFNPKDLQRKGLKLNSVILGEYDQRQDPDCDGDRCSYKKHVNVDEVILHPDYTKNGPNANDVAIIRLAEDVEFTDYIHPICLPFTDEVQNDQETFVAGWGSTGSGDSPIKLFIKIPVVNDTYCQNTYLSMYKRKIDSQHHFCAGGSDRKDSCSGDSGGPLMAVQRSPVDRSNRYVALGVVSFGPGKCGMPGVPGVYTRIHTYVPWIMDQLKA